MPELTRVKRRRSRDAEKRYVDLCNEELFYCEAGYVPEVVVREWLNGMTDFLPHYHGRVVSGPFTKTFDEMVDYQLLDSYPRVKRVFSVGRPYDLAVSSERVKLISELSRNLARPSKWSLWA